MATRLPGAKARNRRRGGHPQAGSFPDIEQLSRTPAPPSRSIPAPQPQFRPLGDPYPQRRPPVPPAFQATGEQPAIPALPHRESGPNGYLRNGGWRPDEAPQLWAPPISAGEMQEVRDLVAGLPDAKPQSSGGGTPIGDAARAAVRRSGPQAAAPRDAEVLVTEAVPGPAAAMEAESDPDPFSGLLRAMLLRACWDAVQYYAPVDGECASCRDGEVCDWHWRAQMNFAEFECLHDQILASVSDDEAIAIVKAAGVDLGELSGWGSPFAAALEGGV